MVTSHSVVNFLVYCISRNTCEWSRSGCQNQPHLRVMVVAQCPCNKGGDTNKKRLPLSICSSPRADRVSGFSLVQCIVCAFMKPRLFSLSIPCQDQIKCFLWSLAHLRNIMKWRSYLLTNKSGENISFSEVIKQKGKDQLFSWKKLHVRKKLFLLAKENYLNNVMTWKCMTLCNKFCLLFLKGK